MVYRRKIELVNAKKWDGSALGKEMCVFLGGYIDGVVKSIGDHYYTDHDRVTGGLMIIKKDGSAVPCMVGYYVVLNDENGYDVMNADKFEKQYEEHYDCRGAA